MQLLFDKIKIYGFVLLTLLLLSLGQNIGFANNFNATFLLRNDPLRIEQIEYFRQARLELNKENYRSACKLLNLIKPQQDSIQQIILYHIAICRWHLNDWPRFIRASKLIKGRFVKNLLSQLIIESINQKKSLKMFLNADINEMIQVFPNLGRNIEFIVHYLKNLKDDKRAAGILKNLWFYAPTKDIKRNLKGSLQTKFIAIPKKASLKDWEKYFALRLSSGQFRLIMKEAPPIITKFKSTKLYPGTIVKYYVQSMFATRHYTKLLNYLEKKENQLIFEFFPREMHSLKAKALLKLNRITKAQSYATKLAKKNANNNTADYVFLEIGNHFFFWEQEYKPAKEAFDKINTNRIRRSDIEQLQWQRLFSAIILKDKETIGKIYSWYKKHSFASENLNAHFCYWIHGKAFIMLGLDGKKLIDCYADFSNQYYGLRSIVDKNFQYYQKQLIQKEVLPVQDKMPDKNKLQLIELIRIMSLFKDNRAAEYFLKIDFAKSKDLGYLKAIADSFNEDNLYHLSQNLYISVLKGASLDDEFFHPAFLKSIYPLAFQDTVEITAKNFNVPDNLVYSIMREESHYDPLALSRVGAMGLMQLMGGTAKQMSRQLHVNIKNKEFIEPSNNILLGTFYLKNLLKNFNNSLVATIASYNAGPNNVKKWLKKNPTDDIDIFVEMIPFGETRRYVKRVLRSYFAYEIIYSNDNYKN